MQTPEDMKKKLEELLEQSATADPPKMPTFLDDPRLEDAFKVPDCNEEGYANKTIPIIWNDFSFGKKSNGVKVLSLKSASIASNQYCKYLDETALVWNAQNNELFLYVPDSNCSEVAFNGSAWCCAKKFKPEFSDESLVAIIIKWQNS